MAQITVAKLSATVEELRAEVDELRAYTEELREYIDTLHSPHIQFVKELHDPKPVSKPLDFNVMQQNLADTFSAYDEDLDVYRIGPGAPGWNGYL